MTKDNRLDIADMITDARNMIECVFMASNSLSSSDRNAIASVASVAIDRLNTAIALLDGSDANTDHPAGEAS